MYITHQMKNRARSRDKCALNSLLQFYFALHSPNYGALLLWWPLLGPRSLSSRSQTLTTIARMQSTQNNSRKIRYSTPGGTISFSITSYLCFISFSTNLQMKHREAPKRPSGFLHFVEFSCSNYIIREKPIIIT